MYVCGSLPTVDVVNFRAIDVLVVGSPRRVTSYQSKINFRAVILRRQIYAAGTTGAEFDLPSHHRFAYFMTYDYMLELVEMELYPDTTVMMHT